MVAIFINLGITSTTNDNQIRDEFDTCYNCPTQDMSESPSDILEIDLTKLKLLFAKIIFKLEATDNEEFFLSFSFRK